MAAVFNSGEAARRAWLGAGGSVVEAGDELMAKKIAETATEYVVTPWLYQGHESTGRVLQGPGIVGLIDSRYCSLLGVAVGDKVKGPAKRVDRKTWSVTDAFVCGLDVPSWLAMPFITDRDGSSPALPAFGADVEEESAGAEQ